MFKQASHIPGMKDKQVQNNKYARLDLVATGSLANCFLHLIALVYNTSSF